MARRGTGSRTGITPFDLAMHIPIPFGYALIAREEVEISSREVVLPFPKPHRLRRRAAVGSRQGAVISFGESEADGGEREELVGPKAR